MSNKESQFFELLDSLNTDNPKLVKEQFETYLNLLWEANQYINLVSRKTLKEDYWINHFLDSLIVFRCLDFKNKTVLDFGTGGGLPGIPVKLVEPSCRMILLDSIGKKITALQSILREMNINGCEAIRDRLEDYAEFTEENGFDYILCRSVKLEERYYKPLRKLLKPEGRVVFYKARILDDIKHLKVSESCELEHPELGLRKIICIARKDIR